MGGPGSGRRRGDSQRLRTDEAEAFDVRGLKRAGVITTEHGGMLLTGDQFPDGELYLELTWTCAPDGSGERPWFVCPGEGCGRRCAILYDDGAHDRLLCRVCLGLVYPSQYPPPPPGYRARTGRR